MNPRINQLVSKCVESNCDAYLVNRDVNITYLTQFPAVESWLLVTPKKTVYMTDARYTLEAKKGLRGCVVHQYSQSIMADFFKVVQGLGARRVGFDDRYLSFASYKQMKNFCPSGIKMVVKRGIIENMRCVKEKKEIDQMRACLKLHFKALRYLKKVIRPGITEHGILAELEMFVRSHQAGFAFDSIVASGPNSCFPHAKVTQRRIRNNEPVMIDMGIDLGGYKSDLTRMFFLGKIPPLVKEVNDYVVNAQRAAIEIIHPKQKAASVDQVARNYLQEKKLAKYFNHSLGHGVGLEIHEDPRITQNSPVILQEGMVFTIEPAVYIPNKFGIRIEDMVLVTKDGSEVLSGQR